MKRARLFLLLLVAALLVLAHLIARAGGLAEHTSAIAGMPLSPASIVLGPLHVAGYLLLVVIAPILAIAGTIDTVLLLRRT
jgi:hypothetical protein